MSTRTTTVRNHDIGTLGMRRRAAKLFLSAALVLGSLLAVGPATASADALVLPQAPCVAYANGGANFYSGSGTEVVTPNGDVVLTCHLALVRGTPVAEPTSSTYGNCELLQLPSGRAQLSCHYSLV